MAMSQDGNEMSFEVETTGSDDGGFPTMEDEMSGVGSQYGDMSEFDAIAEDSIAFNDGGELEETLFGF
jgi:hypothetical protein